MALQVLAHLFPELLPLFRMRLRRGSGLFSDVLQKIWQKLRVCRRYFHPCKIAIRIAWVTLHHFIFQELMSVIISLPITPNILGI